MTKKITATISRGKYEGMTLVPHRHADGSFVVSPTRFVKDDIRVKSLTEVTAHLRDGLSLRMSCALAVGHAPSLVCPASINGIA